MKTEGSSRGYIVGRHWAGVKGLREYSKVKASRLAGKLAWTRWARAFAGVAGRSALGGVGLALGVGEAAYHLGKMVMKRKKSQIKRPVKRSRKNVPRKARPIAALAAKMGRVKLRARRRRVKRSGGVGTEYSRLRLRGSKKGRSMSLGRLVRMACVKRVLRFQGLRPFERYSTTTIMPGYFWLQSTASGTNTDWVLGLPWHLYCLNSTINNNGSTVQTFGVAPTLINATPYIQFAAIGGVKNDGTGTYSYQTESRTGADAASQYIQAVGYDIRMLLHNAKNQPTVFIIEIVSFLDDYLDPMRMFNAGPTDSTDEIVDRAQWYTNMSRQLYANPLVPAQRRPRKGWRVYKRIVVHMKPDQTTNTDGSPSTKEVRLFFKDGKTYDYMWTADLAAGNQPNSAMGRTMDPNLFDVDVPAAGDAQAIPKTRARLYLSIRALDPTFTGTITSWPGGNYGNLDASSDNTNTPSYDMCVRKIERYTV